jgi:hypothetical protein
MTFRDRLPFWGIVEEVGAIDVFERTLVAGTRRDAAADGGGRRAVPLRRGGAGMVQEVEGLSLGGLDERAGGGAMLGTVSLAFVDDSCFCSCSDVLVKLPSLEFGLTSSCGFNET